LFKHKESPKSRGAIEQGGVFADGEDGLADEREDFEAGFLEELAEGVGG